LIVTFLRNQNIKKMSKLKSKVAIVTGSSKGIGAGIARELAHAGAKVVVNYNSAKEEADTLVDEINKAGGTAIAIQGSVTNRAHMAKLFDETKSRFGMVDILVNNAGIYACNRRLVSPLDGH
jgi:3-oxoacyl-[acyl-carrier protein] reductase